MPDIVVVKEGEQDAVSVVFTRLGWSFLSPQGEKQQVNNTQTHTLIRFVLICVSATPTCQVLRPWKKK